MTAFMEFDVFLSFKGCTEKIVRIHEQDVMVQILNRGLRLQG